MTEASRATPQDLLPIDSCPDNSLGSYIWLITTS